MQNIDNEIEDLNKKYYELKDTKTSNVIKLSENQSALTNNYSTLKNIYGLDEKDVENYSIDGLNQVDLQNEIEKNESSLEQIGTVNYLAKEDFIKKFLLNQKNISGLGNIYVNEILFLSKVNPFLSTFKLTSDTWETIFSNIRKILKKAIKNNGTTLSDMTYYLPLGDYGNHQNNLLIYGRHICFSCSGKIDKLFIDSRATYMCYKCQK